MPVITSNPVAENRLGTFSIDTKFFEKEPGLIMRIMGKCIIVEAYPHYHSRSIEYIAYSPEFSHIPEGQKYGIYNIEVEENYETGIKDFKFKEVEETNAKILRRITY